MSLLPHPKAREVVSESCDFFSPVNVETSFEANDHVQIFPLNSIQRRCPIEFCYSSDSVSYLSLPESYLKLNLRLVRNTNQILGVGQNVAPINSFAESIFSGAETRLNSYLVSRPDGHYAYKAYLSKLLFNPETVQKRVLGMSGYWPDTPGRFNEVGANNLGYVIRKQIAENSENIHVVCKIYDTIWNQERLIPNLIDLKLKLLPNVEGFSVIGGDGDSRCHLQVEGISLFLKRYKLTPSLTMQIEKIWHQENFKFFLSRKQVSAHTIAAHSTNFYLGDCLFQNSTTPRQVFLGFVRTSAYDGNTMQNPFFLNT